MIRNRFIDMPWWAQLLAALLFVPALLWRIIRRLALLIAVVEQWWFEEDD